jgi:hypothetical protein
LERLDEVAAEHESRLLQSSRKQRRERKRLVEEQRRRLASQRGKTDSSATLKRLGTETHQSSSGLSSIAIDVDDAEAEAEKSAALSKLLGSDSPFVKRILLSRGKASEPISPIALSSSPSSSASSESPAHAHKPPPVLAEEGVDRGYDDDGGGLLSGELSFDDNVQRAIEELRERGLNAGHDRMSRQRNSVPSFIHSSVCMLYFAPVFASCRL